MKDTVILFIIVFVVSARSQYSESGLCASKCLCIQQNDKMVVCNTVDGLSAIPTNVPTMYSRFLLQNIQLMSPVIYKYNMTGLEHLTYLKIIYCKLEAVEAQAFENMPNLEYLDLSHNRIKIILPFTFSGLNLKSLHLMENPGIKVERGSFAGLKVKQMNLRSNLITQLFSSDFKNLDLIELFLFNNSLRTIDQGMAAIFDKPGHLMDVSKNPLHCDCHFQWLAKNLRQQPKDNLKYVNITCSTPLSLAQRSLSSLTDRDLNCRRPHIQSLAIDFSSTQTQLSCLATSESREAEISWTYEENGQKKEFRKIHSNGQLFPQYGTLKSNLSVKVFIPPNEKRIFTCSTWIKDNDPQTVSVHIRTPNIQYPTFSNDDRKPGSPETIHTPAIEDSNYLFKKQFTVLEMIGAVVGTFTVTVFVLLIVAHFIRLYRYRLMKTASLKPYWPHNPGQESMYSQPVSHNGEYEIPRVCETHTFPPPPSFDHIEFLDFKNHNKLYPKGS